MEWLAREGWQWIAVAAIVALAVWRFVRVLRKDPCVGCPIKDKCDHRRKCDGRCSKGGSRCCH